MSRIWLLVLTACILIRCGDEFEQGKRIYEYHCANCHMSNGRGLKKLIPPIADSDYYRENVQTVPCIIRYGLQDSIVVNGVGFNEKMEGISSLSAAEITNVINYMHSKWYPDLPYTTVREVEGQLNSCSE